MQRVTAAETEVAPVERCQDLARRDQLADASATDSDLHDLAAERLSSVVPTAFAQPVWRVLGDDAHDLGPLCAPSTRLGSTSEGMVASMIGVSEGPLFGSVEGPLDSIDAGSDDDRRSRRGSSAAGKVGVPARKPTFATTPAAGCCRLASASTAPP